MFEELRTGSTVTQRRAPAEAFSHRPSALSYEDDGSITHNGTAKGYLYAISEPVTVGEDVYRHPRTSMDPDAEFLTRRPLKVRLIAEL